MSRISQKMLKISTLYVSLKIRNSRLQTYLPGVNGLTRCQWREWLNSTDTNTRENTHSKQRLLAFFFGIAAQTKSKYCSNIKFILWHFSNVIYCLRFTVYILFTVYGESVYGIRADPKFAPSQWVTSLQSNAVSHWLGANLESSLGL